MNWDDFNPESVALRSGARFSEGVAPTKCEVPLTVALHIGFSAHAYPLEVGPSTPYNSILRSKCFDNIPSLRPTLLWYKVNLLNKMTIQQIGNFFFITAYL